MKRILYNTTTYFCSTNFNINQIICFDHFIFVIRIKISWMFHWCEGDTFFVMEMVIFIFQSCGYWYERLSVWDQVSSHPFWTKVSSHLFWTKVFSHLFWTKVFSHLFRTKVFSYLFWTKWVNPCPRKDYLSVVRESEVSPFRIRSMMYFYLANMLDSLHVSMKTNMRRRFTVIVDICWSILLSLKFALANGEIFNLILW